MSNKNCSCGGFQEGCWRCWADLQPVIFWKRPVRTGEAQQRKPGIECRFHCGLVGTEEAIQLHYTRGCPHGVDPYHSAKSIAERPYRSEAFYKRCPRCKLAFARRYFFKHRNACEAKASLANLALRKVVCDCRNRILFSELDRHWTANHKGRKHSKALRAQTRTFKSEMKILERKLGLRRVSESKIDHVEGVLLASASSMDATRLYAHAYREHGRFGSHASHDAFGDESTPN